MPIRLKEPSKYQNSAPGLPSNYNFELSKTLGRIERLIRSNPSQATTTITLQFPDGLLQFSPVISDVILSNFDVSVTVLSDVIYGACCVDDHYESDLLIHYGHSCLINVNEMSVSVLYVFVEVAFETDHLMEMICREFVEKGSGPLSLISTVQFNSLTNGVAHAVNRIHSGSVIVPQVRPLSRGEVLGCTSPVIRTENTLYIGDGRFHLEAAMIGNRGTFYKYCPFSRRMTREEYDVTRKIETRKKAVESFRKSESVGIVMSGLGKQGNRLLVKRVGEYISRNMGECRVYRISVNEVSGEVLDAYSFIDGFVQVGCPRLSIDWGESYHRPLLNPYELMGLIGDQYEMDYYSKEDVKPWGSYYG
ncbi:DPH1 [Enterospora canceri]|uniref:2-(3-amino-3-carboxypropyl)histidine synthase subunit 1 n=1 Tax=Enterospora canceri TaxID=1081671 RepID=A0A1Y1S5N9_9MICR|nr:DPH1 [Enterospora canceri]